MIRFTNIPKVFLVSILLAFTLFPSLAARRPEGQYRVMTCNIRITGLEADDPYPERVWENRKDLCIKTIRDEKPDFFCLQEVIYDSYQYFVEKFGKDYYYYGFVGPEMDPWTDVGHQPRPPLQLGPHPRQENRPGNASGEHPPGSQERCGPPRTD